MSLKESILKNPLTEDDVSLARDAFLLFTGQEEGHMGKWEYGPSLYENDPGGGADLWSQMVKKPGAYYVTDADIKLINWAVEQDVFTTFLHSTETLIEFGPGSDDIVLKKTIPLIKGIRSLQTYVALDISRDFAEDTARIATQGLEIKAQGIEHDFSKPLLKRSTGNTAYAILGSTISNMECGAGTNPFYHLVNFLRNLREGMADGDVFLTSFDMMKEPSKILRAYSGNFAKKHGINLIYRLHRDGIVTGNFNPLFWRYEPLWFPETAQCCHTVFPVVEQVIKIQGFEMKIPAFRRYVTNNSFKYSPKFVAWAASMAGFGDCTTLYHQKMGILLARV